MANFKYACLIMQQRGPDTPSFCMFQAEVGEVLKWGAIRRLTEEPRTPQRPANESKVRAIKRFFDGDTRNTIPTSVIVTLNVQAEVPTIPCEQGQHIRLLSFDVAEGCVETEKPGLVIDGQHRLLGINQFDPHLKVGVVALLNANIDETAFQFLVINHKASKVQGDHIRALALEFNRDALDARLKTARLSLSPNLAFVDQVNLEDDSPFKDLIAFARNRTGNGIVVPAAIEASLTDIQSNRVKALDDADTLIEFFFAIWRPIKRRWVDLWVRESRLLDKVGIICMNKYLSTALIKLSDLGYLDLENPTEVEEKTDTLLNFQSKELWTSQWRSSSYDTRAGREMIVHALEVVNRNLRASRPWFDEVELVDIPTTPPNA